MKGEPPLLDSVEHNAVAFPGGYLNFIQTTNFQASAQM